MNELQAMIEPETTQTAFRMLTALILCGAVGFEREIRRSPAGLRTHMLVGAGSCLFMILTDIIAQRYSMSNDAIRADPIRIIGAVTSGVAFLAAGTIIHARGRVSGLTTGSSLWIAGAIGVGCGLGEYQLSIVAVVVTLLVLAAVRLLEHRFLGKPKVSGRSRFRS